jgi:hypothetical protein
LNNEIYYATDIVPAFTDAREKRDGIYPIDLIGPVHNNFEPQHGYSWNSVWPSFNHRPLCAPKCPIKKTPWSESARELYRPSDRRLSAAK